jgi:urease accessory protein
MIQGETIRKLPLLAAVAAAVAGLAAGTAEAHVGPIGPGGGFGGFASGFAHPLLGLDHLLAMVAVGVWGALVGGRALWMFPLAFVAAMTAGLMLGLGGVAVPFVEPVIALSVILFGAAVAAAIRPGLPLALAFIAVGALAHGHAHGTEMPMAAASYAYGAGMVLATALLHGAGVYVATAAIRAKLPVLARTAGAVTAVIGIGFLVGM